MKKIITNSEKETLEFAKALASKAVGGEVYALSGDLGAGKTVFVRGFAAGLGLKHKVNSPTFVLMKVYPIKKHETIKHLCHVDAYRLRSARDLEAIGALDYFGKKDSICFVEWPENVKKTLPQKAKYIKILHANEKRELQIKNRP